MMSGNQQVKDENSPTSIGAIIDRLHALRENKRRLNKELTEVEKVITEVKAQAIEALDAAGVDLARGVNATASITETEVPEIEDWDAFTGYIRDNDAWYLLQRRVSSQPWRELKQSGEPVPGVKTFIKRDISLRTK